MSRPQAVLPMLAQEAAKRGDLGLLQEILRANPAVATSTDQDGWTPLGHAVEGLQEGAVRLLLEAAPAAALMQDADGDTPLMLTAFAGAGSPAHFAEKCEAIVRLLLAAAPAAAGLPLPPVNGPPGIGLPLHVLAWWADETLMREVLAAAPHAPFVNSLPYGYPLHVAAMAANVAAVRVLLGAAPAVAQYRAGSPAIMFVQGGEQGCLPLEHCLGLTGGHTSDFFHRTASGKRVFLLQDRFEAACLLALATPTDAALAALDWAHSQPFRILYAPMYIVLAVDRPLTPDQWERIPRPCPGLGAALPAVLARSEGEAAALVARLPGKERQRLRCGALCLACAQRQWRVELSGPLVGRILAYVLPL